MFRWVSKTMACVCVGLSVGCGADSNLFSFVTPDGHYDSFEALMAQARASYDRNELDDALKYSKKAYVMNSKSERASILYGLVNLSLAGGDPYGLAKAMIANNKKKTEETPAALMLADGNSADTLTSLKTVLGITDDELKSMATVDEIDPDLPVLVPKCVEGSRKTAERLMQLNEAIMAVCPFTDEDVRIGSDYRQMCETIESGHKQTDQAHFLWAFAHLTEALAFNAVLTYGDADPDGKKSNLELRVDKLKSMDTSTPEGVTALVAAVDTTTAMLESIMPISGKCSEEEPTHLIRATLNDMLAVDAAFGRMPGIPPKVSAGIEKAMARIKAVTVSNGTPITAQTQAMKKDFSKKMATSLAEKIDGMGADPENPLPAEQKTALCDSFAAIAPDPTISTVCASQQP